MKQLLVLTLVLISMCLKGQETTSFSLREAQKFAYNNNEQVKNSLLDIESARKRIWESTAIGLPQVNAEADFQYFIDVPTSVADASVFNPQAPEGELVDFRLGTDYNSKAGVTLSQLIFDGSYFVGLKAAKNFKTLVEKQFDQTKTEIHYQITNAYIGVLIAQENIVLLDSLVNTTQKLYESTKKVFESGLAGEIEVDQVELSLNNVKNAKIRAERNLALSENLLKFQMGYPLEDDIELTDNIDVFMSDIKKDLKVLPEGFIRNHIDYMVLQEQRELNELNRQLERVKNYPSLGAFFTHNQQAFRNEFDFFTGGDWFPTTIVGLNLKIPITSSGMRLARESQKRIVVEQMDNNLSLMERSLKLQFTQAKTRYENAYAVYESEQRNLEVSQKIYNNSVISETQGFSGALRVTQAQNQLITAQQTYINSLYELLEAKNELDKLTNDANNNEINNE